MSKVLRNSLNIKDIPQRSFVYNVSTTPMTVIPDNFNGAIVWKKYISDIRNQGLCGSCWAFASLSCLSDRINIYAGLSGANKLVLSPAHLISCGFALTKDVEDLYLKALNKIEKATGQEKNKLKQELRENLESVRTSIGCSGSTITNVLLFLSTFGAMTESCVPLGYPGNLNTIQTFPSKCINPLSIDDGDTGNKCYNLQLGCAPDYQNKNKLCKEDIYVSGKTSKCSSNFSCSIKKEGDNPVFEPLFCSQLTSEKYDKCINNTPAQRYKASSILDISIDPNVITTEAAYNKRLNNIKYEIYNYGPIISGYMLGSDFYELPKNKVYLGASPSTTLAGGHAIKIVGWGKQQINRDNYKNYLYVPHEQDQLTKEFIEYLLNKGYVEYWIIANSWGNNFSNDGYFYLIMGKDRWIKANSNKSYNDYQVIIEQISSTLYPDLFGYKINTSYSVKSQPITSIDLTEKAAVRLEYNVLQTIDKKYINDYTLVINEMETIAKSIYNSTNENISTSNWISFKQKLFGKLTNEFKNNYDLSTFDQFDSYILYQIQNTLLTKKENLVKINSILDFDNRSGYYNSTAVDYIKKDITAFKTSVNKYPLCVRDISFIAGKITDSYDPIINVNREQITNDYIQSLIKKNNLNIQTSSLIESKPTTPKSDVKPTGSNCPPCSSSKLKAEGGVICPDTCKEKGVNYYKWIGIIIFICIVLYFLLRK